MNRALLFVMILAATAAHAQSSTSPTQPEAKRAEAELCAKFMKASLSTGVIRAYGVPGATVGTFWYGLPFADKSQIAHSVWKCLYRNYDGKQPKVLAFFDYYTGKRIGHIDVAGAFTGD